MRRLYHFLGGVLFAVILIVSTALYVIAGTILESLTDSHRYAAMLTFSSPLFTVLLALFFVNILIAALRRWPFKRRHAPFLITHLGLLMLLAGAIGKQFYGLQGNMSLVEGSGSQKVMLANSEAIEVTSPHAVTYWPINGGGDLPSNLQLSLMEWRRNSREKLEFWIKGDEAYIRGLPPVGVKKWTAGEPLAKAISMRLGESYDDSVEWDLHSYTTSDIELLAAQAYLDGLLLTVSDAITQRVLGTIPLYKMLQDGFAFNEGVVKGKLDLDFSVVEGFGTPMLELDLWEPYHLNAQKIVLPLSTGAHSMLSISPFRFTLSRRPSLVIVGDPYEDSQLWFFDTEGHVASELFRRETLESLVAYRNGFDGYAVESSVMPALEAPVTRLHVIQRPSTKVEDNLPLVLLKAAEGDKQEQVPLTFDRAGQGIRWPILNGSYLVRYQPACCDIPYRLRLHHAQQVSHPSSSQPYSYEARVTVTDRRDGSADEVVLSMNHVHETPDGYRFYLAGIAPPNDMAVRQVQIVVNHDPFKYVLTYPGALALVLGIGLLFTRRR